MSKAKKHSGLGRGLGSILSTDGMDQKVAVKEIHVDLIEPNPFQPRTEDGFDDESLSELSESIKAQGVIQPLTVRKIEGKKYQLIAGERRLRASKLAKLAMVPVYILTANEQEMREMALVENLQRKDLDPIEVALAYQLAITELGMKQEDLGKRVGKPRSVIANYTRLLKLPPDIQTGLKRDEISFGHAKVINGLSDQDKQLVLFELIKEKKLSVRQTEEARELLKNPKKKKEEKKPAPSVNDIYLNDTQKLLRDHLQSNVSIKQKSNGKGQIVVSFENNDDLNRILEILELI
ncbi:MAG: ParB/RepB/Spo0J family partition protein [Bacteroidota bacterium]